MISPSLIENSYFINDQDQIKKIADPKQDFQFKINKNHRWNDKQKEAMNCTSFIFCSYQLESQIL